MSENERNLQLIQAVAKGDERAVGQLLCEPNISVDCCDETGMTPLMHAAYKGKANICDLLLKNGANVNCNKHEHQYTPLMFAALAGSVETARVLLEAGASTKATNKVKRTASQLGAFVGQHHVVSFINSFVPFDELEYYTKPHGLESEPKLPPSLARTFHKLLLCSNMNPCRIVIFMMDNMVIHTNWETMVSMLELLCEKSMKAQETNEIMAMRMYYFSCIIKAAAKHEGGPSTFLKYLLKGKEPDGSMQIGMEQFIRQAIRSFPYHESALFVQLVRNIAPVKLGEEPTALSVLTTGINGHQSAEFSESCHTCGEKGASMKCSACKKVKYCDQRCQKLHWFTHKKFCKFLANEYLLEQNQEKDSKEASENISQSVDDCKSEVTDSHDG